MFLFNSAPGAGPLHTNLYAHSLASKRHQGELTVLLLLQTPFPQGGHLTWDNQPESFSWILYSLTIHRALTLCKPQFLLCTQEAEPSEIPSLCLMHFGHTAPSLAHWKCHLRSGPNCLFQPIPYHPSPCSLSPATQPFPAQSTSGSFYPSLSPALPTATCCSTIRCLEVTPSQISLTTLSKPGVIVSDYPVTNHHELTSF